MYEPIEEYVGQHWCEVNHVVVNCFPLCAVSALLEPSVRSGIDTVAESCGELRVTILDRLEGCDVAFYFFAKLE